MANKIGQVVLKLAIITIVVSHPAVRSNDNMYVYCVEHIKK